MNDLTIFEQNGQLLTDSREVARMVEKEHYDLIKNIRQYITYLTDGDFDVSGSSILRGQVIRQGGHGLLK